MKSESSNRSSRRLQRTQRVAQGNDPIESLLEEHKKTLKHVEMLRRAVEGIRQEGFSIKAYRRIAEAILFIDTIVRKHDKKEEECLLPLLARHVPDPPRVLRYEHRELWSALKQLVEIVDDVRDGNIRGSSIVDLVRAAETVAELLANHIAKENEIVFPMAKRLLSVDEYEELRRRIVYATRRSKKNSEPEPAPQS